MFPVVADFFCQAFSEEKLTFLRFPLFPETARFWNKV